MSYYLESAAFGSPRRRELEDRRRDLDAPVVRARPRELVIPEAPDTRYRQHRRGRRGK